MSLPLTDAGAVKARKVDLSETARQAQRWDDAFTRYTRAGLCGSCASQAAWAGQIGYARAHPPCADCAPIVADFPGAEHVNGWRSLPEMARDRRRGRTSATGSGAEAPGTPSAPLPGVERPLPDVLATI